MRLFSWFALLAAVALVAVAAGCGGGGSTTSSSTQASTPATTTAPEQGPEGEGSKPSGGGGEEGSGSGGGGSEGGSAGDSAKTAQLKQQISKEETEPGDHSIQEFGSEASEEEEEAVVSAMHTFIVALASQNYAGVCSGLAKSNREQLEKYIQATKGTKTGCAAVLKKLVVPAGAAEAKKSLNPTIGRVRIGEGSAFVLFKPAGGKLNYFVLKEEDGEWKSVSLSAGTPFAP